MFVYTYACIQVCLYFCLSVCLYVLYMKWVLVNLSMKMHGVGTRTAADIHTRADGHCYKCLFQKDRITSARSAVKDSCVVSACALASGAL